MGGEEGDAGLGPFVEALAQLHSEGVLHAECPGLVVEGVVRRAVVGVVAEIVRWYAAAEDVVAVKQALDVEGVEEAGDGYELLRDDLLALPLQAQAVEGEGAAQGVCLDDLSQAVGLDASHEFEVLGHDGLEAVGHFEVAVFAEVVAMGEVVGVVVVAVEDIREPGRNVATAVALWEALRVGDVLVALDTTVLCHLHVLPRRHRVHVVVFAEVVAEDGASELGVVLVHVVAATIEVVNLEADGRDLVDVRGEVGTEAVLTVLARAASVVLQVGEGRLGVGEEEAGGCGVEVVVGLGEEEVGGYFAVEVVACETRRAEVAEDVVLTIESLGEVPVLEEVGQGVVVFLGEDGAQTLIDAPLVELRGHGAVHLRGVASPGAALLSALVVDVVVVVAVGKGIAVVAKGIAHTIHNVLCPQR